MTVHTNTPDPFNLFADWHQQELTQSNSQVPSACCLSTLGTNGYPNARFVSLKTVHNGAFIITGSVQAQKGVELKQHPKAALTFWFTATEKQIRLQGDALPITHQQANQYFASRSLAAKAVSVVSQQGQPLANPAKLALQHTQAVQQYQNTEIQRPVGWGGFAILPVNIEFLTFNSNRLHLRQLFTKTDNDQWAYSYLQP